MLKEIGKFGPLDIVIYYSSALISDLPKKSPAAGKQEIKQGIKQNIKQEIKHDIKPIIKAYDIKRDQQPEIAPSAPAISKYSLQKHDFGLTSKREGTVIVTIVWPYPASRVELTGSFANWKQLYLLHQEGDVLLTRLYLEPGVYQYKFLVNGLRWCYDITKPIRQDSSNFNNEMVVIGRSDQYCLNS